MFDEHKLASVLTSIHNIVSLLKDSSGLSDRRKLETSGRETFSCRNQSRYSNCQHKPEMTSMEQHKKFAVIWQKFQEKKLIFFMADSFLPLQLTFTKEHNVFLPRIKIHLKVVLFSDDSFYMNVHG